MDKERSIIRDHNIIERFCDHFDWPFIADRITINKNHESGKITLDFLFIYDDEEFQGETLEVEVDPDLINKLCL